MWPDGVRSTTVSFALTCIDEVDLIDIAIAIPVVRCPVFYFVLGEFDGLADHLSRVLVVALAVVLTIVGIIIANGDRPHDVEVEFKFPATLCLEIVGHRALEIALAVALFVGNVLIQLIVVGSQELLVLEVHQDHDSLFRSQNGCGVAKSTLLNASGIDLGTASLGTFADSLEINGLKILVVALLSICLTIGSQPIVTMFIANESCADLCAIGQRQRLPLSALGRHCHHRHSYCHEGEE